MSLSKRFRPYLRRIRSAPGSLYIRLAGPRFTNSSCPDSELQRILAGSAERSDISDHLGDIYFHALDSPSELIVELGTRGGESTRALLGAANATDRQVLSVDVDPCGTVDLPHTERWHFVQADDVQFGRENFSDWCETANLPPRIGTLFIDTSHLYEHTREEINAWFPHLVDGALVLFHDTNMGDGRYARMDGSIGCGWDNERGVIRAIEERLGRQYDESTRFVDLTEEFLVRHTPYCNGLTVLRKL